MLDVGINELLAAAGVAKASLYQHFGSKDALLVAWLTRRQEQWFGWFAAHIAERASEASPREELEAAFDFLRAWLRRKDFAGCPFLDAAMHIDDREHPVAAQARVYAERLETFFAERLRRLGIARPAARASLLLSTYLGAVTVRQLGLRPSPGPEAASALSHLLEAWLTERRQDR